MTVTEGPVAVPKDDVSRVESVGYDKIGVPIAIEIPARYFQCSVVIDHKGIGGGETAITPSQEDAHIAVSPFALAMSETPSLLKSCTATAAGSAGVAYFFAVTKRFPKPASVLVRSRQMTVKIFQSHKSLVHFAVVDNCCPGGTTAPDLNRREGFGQSEKSLLPGPLSA